MQPKQRVLDNGTRTGWLYNLYVTSVTGAVADEMMSATANDTGLGERKGDKKGDKKSDSKGEGAGGDGLSALRLLFQDLDGDLFECSLIFNPYFFVVTVPGHEREVEMGLNGLLAGQGLLSIQQVEKEDLDMINHLSGRKRVFLKLSFAHSNSLVAARQRIELIARRNATADDDNPFLSAVDPFATDDIYEAVSTAPKTSWEAWVSDIREFDMKYHVRVAIDMNVYVGLWYDVSAEQGHISVVRCDDSKYAPAMPKICAYDIETTKAPLKFPQPEIDQIYMISYMIDTRGFLIVNREIVTADITPFEYTPKPEYEGFFEIFNEADEFHLLRRFYDEMKLHRPHVYVTYNGDYFDFPFIHARSIFHGMNMRNEIGFSQGAEGATLNREVPHLDCFYWVKRDSYLPQGSQGLKAVTKAKLGYEPIEVDPEEMLPLAQSKPQQMANYSVSDAVSTYYLYMKYVHPFIFSLCTIIPMPPDEVLRKGSGTLCESLLCVQAFAKNVIFPNKQVQAREKFHNGHLIDTETYIGGRVEALKSGVYRSDIPMRFKMSPEVFDVLISKLDDQLKFAIEVENSTKLEDVTNYDAVKADIVRKLESLRDQPDRTETPLIYHLDVGAMYPNIILTNRLQPPSMVTPDVCAGCCFYSPDNANQCRRDMTWVWKGEMFTAGRHEYNRIKAQIETESFAAAAVAKIDQAATTKKNYGNRKGNVLEGTAFEKKERPWGQGGGGGGKGQGGGGGGGGYRQMSNTQRREAQEALLAGNNSDDNADGSDDENGTKQFNKLGENTQFNMLKKRIGEYSRRAYGKIHETKEIHRTNTVCQRENSFYVDTVRLFRDRRYHYKRELKKWKGNLDKAQLPSDIKEAKSRCVQMESLQLAHKCILNSFYGYVMRKGSRWYSMEMAGIVTYLGATLIKMARELVQQLGVTLELDTDGIWCCLPVSFPEDFTFTTKDPKKKINISYPCVMLNKDVQDTYTNHQYQDMDENGEYKVREECSIYFEVDGPYLAMLLPASREEGKSIKKRYAVFHPDGRLAELKGFELKRRGELMLIKDFQSLVFKRFLDGKTLVEAYASAAAVANNALDLLFSQGEGYDDVEVMEKLTESSSMSRRLAEYPESQKSLALTTARRIAEFLGPQMVKDKGLACHFVISRMPVGKPVTERAIPLNIFKAEPAVRVHFLRKWTGDHSLSVDVGLKAILDWEYYIGRFQGTVQKIITIPAALQGVPNPVPRIRHPDWLHKRLQQQSSRYRQVSLAGLLSKMGGGAKPPGQTAVAAIKDIEDALPQAPKRIEFVFSSDDDKDDASVASGDDGNPMDAEEEKMREERERLEAEALVGFEAEFLQAKPQKALTTAFFGHAQFPNWLQRCSAQWAHRAKLRKEIAAAATAEATAAGATPSARTGAINMTDLFIDTRAKALSATWHILEVRPVPHRSDQVQVFVLLDRVLHNFTVNMDRVVLVDVDPTTEIAGARTLVGRVLPRRCDAGKLLEVRLTDATGDRVLNELQFLREDVRQVYENHIPPVMRFATAVGAVATVDRAMHLGRQHRRGEFAADEFDMGSSEKYLQQMPPTVFIYHSSLEARGIIAAVYPATNTALVVFVMPAAAQRPAVNWNTLAEEAMAGLPAGTIDPKSAVAPVVTVQYATDTKAAMQLVSQHIASNMDQGVAATKPVIAVVQSGWSTPALTQGLGQLGSLPIIRTAGAAEDERLLTANALNWARPCARRMLLRFFAAAEWLEERASIATVANIPIANIGFDIGVSTLDYLYMRLLKRNAHVLWNPLAMQYATSAIEERPREVAYVGYHHAWVAEVSISQVEVVAVLFSQAIQEADDPRMTALTDGDVTSHFHILRDILSDLYGMAASRKQAAATLLMAFPRWLRDTQSMCYEPKLVEMVSRLVNRTLTALLLRVSKLGGRIVRATADRLLIATNKHTLHDVMGFLQFVLSSLRDQPMLNHLNLQPVRCWGPLLILDHGDYAGLYIPADHIAACALQTLPDPALMTSEVACTVWSRLRPEERQKVSQRLAEIVAELAAAKRSALAEVDANPRATLANRSELLTKLVLERFCATLGSIVEMNLIGDVNDLVTQRVHLAPTAQASGLHSDAAAALEYTKIMHQFMNPNKDDPLSKDVSNVALRIRNNCLTLCGVGKFSPESNFHPDTRERALYIKTHCGFCSDECKLYVGADSGPNTWLCGGCGARFAKPLVETYFITMLNRAVCAHASQDLSCLKCKRVTSNLFANNCCGQLQKADGNSLPNTIQLLTYLASLHDFTDLKESLSFATSCV